MRDPLGRDASEMPLIERDHPIETLTTDGSDQAFAITVRLWRSQWRLHYVQAHRVQRGVDVRRVDAVAVVYEEARPSAVTHSRNCWIVHAAVGCAVMFQCTKRRVLRSSTTNTWRTRKRAVAVTEKSQASSSRAWLRMKVRQVCVRDVGCAGGGRRM